MDAFAIIGADPPDFFIAARRNRGTTQWSFGHDLEQFHERAERNRRTGDIGGNRDAFARLYLEKPAASAIRNPIKYPTRLVGSVGTVASESSPLASLGLGTAAVGLWLWFLCAAAPAAAGL